MKQRLSACSVLLLVTLSGCIHCSRLEVRSGNPGVLNENTRAVENRVGAVLAGSKFAPVRDQRFEQKKQVYPGFVGEWERSEDRGFWLGREHLSVTMHAERDLIRLVVSSGEGGRRIVVEEVSGMLDKMFQEEFPELEVQVTSYNLTTFGP